jgi:hypothetical protein
MVANLFQIYLHDGEGQTILGIGDGTSGSKLCLELINNSDKKIVFQQKNESNYHFELAFRPGTLFEKNVEKITSSATIFKSQGSTNFVCQKLNSNNQLTDNSFSFSYQNNSFFFFCNYKQNNQLIELEKGEKLLFTLENISAEPAGGSRGTRVELKYQNQNLTYGNTNNFINGNQLQYLNIVNQRGSKNLPMYIGFVGSTKVEATQKITTAQDISVTTTESPRPKENKDLYDKTVVNPSLTENKSPGVSIEGLNVVGSNRVLNDGETANTLILTFRYLNRLQENTNKEVGLSLVGKADNIDTATKFRITFDVLADKSTDSGYRLLRETNANAVKMKIYSGSTYLGENVGSEQWDIRTDGQGNTRQWIITCKKDVLNLTDEILRLEISDLKTRLQAGYANLYVYYENIPGYWDGHIICPIEKGPLMLAKDKNDKESVGIGTATPLAKLHVENKVVTETKIAYFKGNSGIQIDGTTGKYNALLISNNNTDIPALFVEQKGTGEAAHFGGSVQIAIDKQSKQPALGIYQKQSTQPAAVFVGGKVGIGTADPKQALDVNGNIYVRNGVIQNGGDPLTTSTDLGLYSHDQYHWIRLVTNQAPIRFFTDGGTGSTIRLSVEKDGNVGIGTTDNESAKAKLDVRGSAIISEKLDAKGDVEVTGRISCGGLIAIVNTDSSKNKKYLSCSTHDGKLKHFAGAINADERFTIEMACSRELKENIASISTEEAISTLEHLNPVKYDYKNDRAFRPNIGFIAEEMPDNLASYDKKSLSPFEVTPILTKVVQEQQKTIALLQQRLDEFERSR